MKNNMNKVLAIALAVTLLALAVTVGTLAYLTDVTQQEVNTFTVGKVAITLTETKGNEFKIVPDTSVAKDPIVAVVDGSEDCWLFVKIEEGTEGLTMGTKTFKDFVNYTVADGWTELTPGSNIYYRSVDSEDAVKSFSVLDGDQVSFPAEIASAEVAGITDVTKPSLTFTAYAIQTANSIDDAAAAWAQVKDLPADVVTP